MSLDGATNFAARRRRAALMADTKASRPGRLIGMPDRAQADHNHHLDLAQPAERTRPATKQALTHAGPAERS